MLNGCLRKKSIFLKFILEIVCVFKKSLYLCTRFREASYLRAASTMILDNIPYRQAVQRVLEYIYLRSLKSKVRNEKQTVKFI